MEKSLRFASAALALTLAAGMTLPAFAAAKEPIIPRTRPSTP